MKPSEMLAQIPLFESLGEKDRRDLARQIGRRSLNRGELLFRRGEEGNSLYIILRGRIRIFAATRRGSEITLALLGPGEFFGEMALLDSQPRSAGAEAAEDAELQVLQREDFFSFLLHNETALRAILLSLSRRLRRTDDLLTEACFLQVSHRLARKLLELSDPAGSGDKTGCSIRVTQQELACLIGTTRESVNKEMKVLRGRGLIESSRNRITIRDRERLKRRSR